MKSLFFFLLLVSQSFAFTLTMANHERTRIRYEVSVLADQNVYDSAISSIFIDLNDGENRTLVLPNYDHWGIKTFEYYDGSGYIPIDDDPMWLDRPTEENVASIDLEGGSGIYSSFNGSTTAQNSMLDTFLKGFFVGIAFELFGLMWQTFKRAGRQALE